MRRNSRLRLRGLHLERAVDAPASDGRARVLKHARVPHLDAQVAFFYHGLLCRYPRQPKINPKYPWGSSLYRPLYLTSFVSRTYFAL